MLYAPISLVGAVPMGDGQTSQPATLSGTIPAGVQPGDLGIGILATNLAATNVYSAPSGWASISAAVSSSANLETQVWAYDVVAGDAGTSLTWSGGGTRFLGMMAFYRGTNGSQGVVVPAATLVTTAGTGLTRPAVTALAPFSYVLGLWAMRVATVAPAPTLTYAGTETFDSRSRTAWTASPNYTLELSHLTTPIASLSEATSAATASASVTNSNSYSLALTPAMVYPSDPRNRARFRASSW